MANAPILAQYTPAQTIYGASVRDSDGFWWNVTNSLWEAFVSGHWSQYAIAMAEFTGSGIYRAAYPIATPVALTTEFIFAQSGGSPVLGDQSLTFYKSQGQNIAAIGNAWQNAQNLAAVTGTEQIGAISGTPTSAVLLPTNLTSVALSAYAGSSIRMTSGALVQQTAYITGYDGAGNITINGFPSGATPASGDLFVIL